jgi:DNA invertase Pin-like site-specific DNA recombinase
MRQAFGSRFPAGGVALAAVAMAWVSTVPQGESEVGLEAQRATVEAFARQYGGAILASLVEVETGKRSDRPALAKTLEAARRGKATPLIAKLDRLARNVAFIANLMDTGVEFLAWDQLFASRLTLHILAATSPLAFRQAR